MKEKLEKEKREAGKRKKRSWKKKLETQEIKKGRRLSTSVMAT